VVVAPEGSELGNLVGTVVQEPDVVSAATAGALGLEDLGDGGVVLEGLDGEDFVNGAVNGELSHGRQAVEVLCLRCTDPTLSAVHHARGAVAICDVRLLPPTFVRLLPAAARAGRLLPHGLHASACDPPSHQ
jgi:hypothetical protein